MKAALITLALTAVFATVGVLVVLGKVPGVPAMSLVPADSAQASGTPPPSADDVAGLRAEMGRLEAELVAADARADSLRHLAEGRRADVEADAEAAQAAAAELAGTLVKLDDDALGAIVQRLDGPSFVALYEASSSRNRIRLMDALTPAQAAAFVRHQLPGGSARTEPDSTTARP